jgi:6-phosphogluconate dehydrogenase
LQLGLVGLGRTGRGMSARLRAAGHEVVGYDVNPNVSDVASLEELVRRLQPPRQVWILVPPGAPTENAVRYVGALMSPGDMVVDGSGSRWTDAVPRARRLAQSGVGYLDCVATGGVGGQRDGYALMVGGDQSEVARLMPIFEALKPPGAAGFVHAGGVGAGHFAAMVHNGIEYGLMQSYAEGYELLLAADLVDDVPAVLASWTSGTAIRSWLLELAARALRDDPELATLRGYANDSGAGRWTVEAGVEHAVPTPVISAAVGARFSSRRPESPAAKLVAVLQDQSADSLSRPQSTRPTVTG